MLTLKFKFKKKERENDIGNKLQITEYTRKRKAANQLLELGDFQRVGNQFQLSYRQER